MHPGLSEADCRVAEFRYRELQAEAERQRRAAHAAPVPTVRVSVLETMQRQVGALMERTSQLFQGARRQKATEHAAVPGTLALSE